MRDERDQLRIVIRQFGEQLKVMARKIEQITIVLGMAQSMHTPPLPPQDDSLPIDLHMSTS